MRPLWPVLLVVVAAGLATLSIALSGPQERPVSRAERALDMPYTRDMDPAERDQLLDLAAAAGADSIKTVAPWDHLEPSEDDYHWGFMDDFIAAAEARNVEVHMQVSATPDWVHPGLDDRVPDRSSRVWYPPRGGTEVGHWHDFVRDLVARYGTRVSSYEMWNEPNLGDFWRGGPDPAEYAAVLRAGYLGAKEADPDVTIVGGSLSQNDVGYTNALYDEIRKYPDAYAHDDFFDAYGVHPYAVKNGEPLAPDYPAFLANYTGPFGRKNSAFLGIEYIRRTLEAHGDSHKKLWVGEFGYNTKAAWMSPTPDATRAGWLEQAYSLLDDRPYVVGMSWYSYYSSTGSGFNIYNRATGRRTLTFRAFEATTPPPRPDRSFAKGQAGGRGPRAFRGPNEAG